MHHAMRRCSNSRGLAALLLAFLTSTLACSPEGEGQRQAGAASTAASGTVTGEVTSDPLVGYDLRRLRPREEEPLATMFERLWTQASTDGKRVAVLFSADWCEPCRILDLELGNTHPRSMIGDVQILEFKEDDWAAAARMDEFNGLRRRWEPVLNTYPLLVLLDAKGERVEEMKEAKERLEAAGLEPTLPIWFDSSRPAG